MIEAILRGCVGRRPPHRRCLGQIFIAGPDPGALLVHVGVAGIGARQGARHCFRPAGRGTGRQHHDDQGARDPRQNRPQVEMGTS